MASPQPSMSDEDRVALAAKLDKELEDFIDGLEKKRYTDGWPEDRWEEEMAKHPFFMKQSPESSDELSPLMEGLQRLKYDPEENTATELAVNYKEDGNFNFKHKNYRMAILGYTEGIKIKCNDPEVNASLYNNRSASHFFLQNYRSSLNDSQKALSFKPDHQKARLRAAQCALRISQFDVCIKYCDEILAEDAADEIALNLKKEATKNKVNHERDLRKKDFLERKKDNAEKQIFEAIKERGIRLEYIPGKPTLSVSDLEPAFPALAGCHVHFDNAQKQLIWPVLLMYPEYHVTDFIQSYEETSILQEHIEEILQTTPEWDREGSYNPTSVNIYYEGANKRSIHKVNPNQSLLDIMKDVKFELRCGTPAFLVFVQNSRPEACMLATYS